jgi:L-malate glycosyltransferase
LKNRVVIVQKYVPQYRVTFFNALKEKLASSGIELLLIYGQGDKIDESKKDAGILSWGVTVPIKTVKTFFGPLFWQNLLPYIQNNDLIVVEQANRVLATYVLFIKKSFGKDIKVAFWGHGINRKLEGNSFANKYKLGIARMADWWFAYTEGVKAMLIANGVSPQKITALQNTIDTKALSETIQSTDQEVNLPLSLRDKVGVFIGGMYQEKQIAFLVEACQRIKGKIPDFKMIFIGAGVDKHIAEAFTWKNDWAFYLGSLFEEEKIPYLKRADVLLIPSAIGLVVIDSFLTETPIVTTDNFGHGPEIEYIQSGYNGIITTFDINAYVDAVVNLLGQDEAIITLKEGCRASARVYSLDNMVDNFASGVKNALNIES